MSLKIFLVTIIIVIPFSCFAQEVDSLCKKSSQISFGYVAAIKHPGISTGFDFPIKSKYKLKEKKKNQNKYYYTDHFIFSKLNWYHHPRYHDNIFIALGWKYRKTKEKGFFNEFSTGIGYSRTFIGSTTYKVSNEGSVFINKDAGYNYALADIGYGIGYDFDIKKTRPVSIYSCIRVITMYPYNSFIYFRPIIEIGMSYKLKKLKC